MEHLIAIQQQQIQGQYQMALRNYIQLAAQLKDNQDLYYILLLNIAQCCLHLNDLHSAQQQINTALSLKNTDWRLPHLSAQVLFKQQKYQECQEQLLRGQEMVSKDPNAVEILDQMTLLH